jgi:hypothetical protein
MDSTGSPAWGNVPGMGKVSDHLIRVESFWSLGNLIWTAIVALWGGVMTWAWSVLSFADQFGFFGYGVVFILSSLSLALVFWACSSGLYRWTLWRAAGTALTDKTKIEIQPTAKQMEHSSERDDEALEILTNFAVDHILPTIDALRAVQQKILRDASDDEVVAAFASEGIFYRNWGVGEMNKSYQQLSAFGGSPQPNFSLREMINFVDTIEKNYHCFVQQLGEMVERLNILPEHSSELWSLWDNWREKHEALKSAYEPVKRMRRLGKPLYRPGLESRWGNVIWPN